MGTPDSRRALRPPRYDTAPARHTNISRSSSHSTVALCSSESEYGSRPSARHRHSNRSNSDGGPLVGPAVTRARARNPRRRALLGLVAVVGAFIVLLAPGAQAVGASSLAAQVVSQTPGSCVPSAENGCLAG